MRAALLIILSVFCAAHLHAQDSVLSRLQQRYHKVEEWHGLYKVHNAMHSPVGWGLYSLDSKQLIEPRYGDIYRPHRDIIIAHPDYGEPGRQRGIVTDTNGKQLFAFTGAYFGSQLRPVIENFSTNCTEARDEHFNLIFSADPSANLSFAENDHLAVFEKSGRLRYYDIRRNMFVHYRVSSSLGGKAALISNPATTSYGIYTDTIIYPMVYKWIEPAGYSHHNPMEKQFIIITAFPDDIAVDGKGTSYRRPTLVLSRTLDTMFYGDYVSVKPIWPGLFYVSGRDDDYHWVDEEGERYEKLEGYTIPGLVQELAMYDFGRKKKNRKCLVLKNERGTIIVDSALHVIKELPDAALQEVEGPFLLFRHGNSTLVLNDRLEMIYEGDESVSFPLLLQQEGDYQRYRPFADSLLVLTKNDRARLLNNNGKEVFAPSGFIGFEVRHIGRRHHPEFSLGTPYIVATRRKVKRYYNRRYDTARACMLLNMAGKPIYKTVFEDGAVVLDTNFSALYKNAKGKYGISSPGGKILLPFVYDNQFYDEYLKKGDEYFVWEYSNGRYTVRPIAVKYKMKDGRRVAYPEADPYGSRDLE